MSPDLIGEGKLLQVAHLKSLLQQSDAEWENLTWSIHRHQERLEVLQRHLAHFRLVLSITLAPQDSLAWLLVGAATEL